MRKISIRFGLLIIILFTSCNWGKKVTKEDSEEKISKAIVNDSSKISINKFLFLKKGMDLNDVKNYLSDNSIKYSNLKEVDTSDINNYTYKFLGIKPKYLIVYNYKISDLEFDEFKIYFIENYLYRFEYLKYINRSGYGNDAQGFSAVSDFSNDNINIIKTMFDGLKEKYGTPKPTSVSNSDSIVTYWSKGNDIDCSIFGVKWNELINEDSNSRDNEISIHLGNSFCKERSESLSGQQEREYLYHQFIDVLFNNIYIDNLIQESLNNREKRDKDKEKDRMNSEKEKKKMLIDGL